jgi:4-hydroxy 2-oxovalerate aldolase
MEYGVRTVRVATHVTEADVGEQHIHFAKKHGLEVVGFLMMSHMAPPEKVAEQAKLFESYGADMVYVTDSAGAMVPADVKAPHTSSTGGCQAPGRLPRPQQPRLGIGNTLAAIDSGAESVDACLRGLGAGAGNVQLEVLTAVLNKMDITTGVDLYKVMISAKNSTP